jgi:hypothetical protein
VDEGVEGQRELDCWYGRLLCKSRDNRTKNRGESRQPILLLTGAPNNKPCSSTLDVREAAVMIGKAKNKKPFCLIPWIASRTCSLEDALRRVYERCP